MEERVISIFQKIFKTDIDKNFDKRSTDKWDSLTHLDLIVSLEEEFKITFTPNEIGSMFSFVDVVNTLKNKLSC